MKRSFLILSAILLASLAGLGYLAFAEEGPPPVQPAGGPPSSSPGPSVAAESQPAPGGAESQPLLVESRPVAVGESDNPGVAMPAASDSTPEQSTGAICGSISLDVSVLTLLRQYRITVSEDINPNSKNSHAKGGRPPFQRVEHRTYKGGATPTFHFEDVPFSEHGYVVRVLAQGLNGSERRVHVNRGTPLGEAVLSLTPGILFSVSVTDQRQNRLEGQIVHLQPDGPPADRAHLRMKTNNYGVALFESVVAGDYSVFVGEVGAPHGPIQKVQVFAYNPIHSVTNHKIQVQNTRVVVPQGKPVRVEVFNDVGYPLEGAELDMHQVETSRFFRYQAKTDRTGTHTFGHVPVGTYELNVTSSGHSRRTIKIYLAEGDPNKTVRVKLY